MFPTDLDAPPEESEVEGWVEPTLANTLPSGSLAFDLERAATFSHHLSAGELVDAIVGFERLAAWVAARQQELIAEFHRRPGDGTARGAASSADPAGESPARRAWAADEIGLALTLAPAAAANRVAQADRFHTVLRPTRDLLAEGRLCPARARLIASMLVEYDDDITAAVQARVLPKAPGQTLGQLRAAVTRAIIAVVPDPADRHRKARRERRVDLYPGRDGMATLTAYLTAAEAVASFNWLTCLARGVHPDPDSADAGRGSMDRRRADVLVALLTGRLIATTAGTAERATDEAATATTDATAATDASARADACAGASSSSSSDDTDDARPDAASSADPATDGGPGTPSPPSGR